MHLALLEIQPRPNLLPLILSFAFGMLAGNSAGQWFREFAEFSNELAEAAAFLAAALIAGYLAFGKTIASDKEKLQLSKEEIVFSLAGILILARWLGSIFGLFIERAFLNPLDINWDTATLLILNLYYVLFAAFSAWLLVRFMKNKLAIPLTQKEALYLTASWIIGMITTSFVCFILGLELENEWGWRIGWLIGGIIIGLGMWLATKQFAFRDKSTYLIASIIGWGSGFLVSEQIFPQLEELFIRIAGESFGWNITVNSNVGFAGLIGGLLLFSQLTGDHNRRVNWKTVLSATIGFALGNALANTIYQSYEDVPFGQLFIWGLLSGASLAVPSKDYKRYLLLGGLGGISLYLGHQAYLALDEHFSLLVGGLFGLSIGLMTKRVGRAVIIMLITMLAFSIRGMLNPLLHELFGHPSWELAIFALTSGITGAIIGSTWSLLKNVDTDPPQQDAET